MASSLGVPASAVITASALSALLLTTASAQVRILMMIPSRPYDLWRRQAVQKYAGRSFLAFRPAFDGTRLHDGAPQFMDYVKHPVLMYGLHIIPSVLWSIAAPLQLSADVRKMSPAAHRWLGTAFLLSSLSLAGSAASMHAMGVGAGRRSIVMRVFVYSLAIWFIYTGWRAYDAARKHKYVVHRLWVMRHVAAGYTVGMQRVFLLVAILLANTGLYTSSKSGEAMYAKERSTFVVVSILGFIASFSAMEYHWLPQLQQQQQSKKSDSPSDKY